MDDSPSGALGCLFCIARARIKGHPREYPQPANIRGVCFACHKYLRDLIRKGQTTDEELIKEHKLLPIRRNPWRRGFRKQLRAQ